MRKARSQEPQWRYAFIGAKAIHLELKALGSPEVPPVRTIHHWFVEEDLVDHSAERSEEKKESKPSASTAPPSARSASRSNISAVRDISSAPPPGADGSYYLITSLEEFNDFMMSVYLAKINDMRETVAAMNNAIFR